MAQNKEMVRFVRYPFSAADLFANWSDLTQYDTDGSAKKYARLCGEALKHTYPNAVIEIIDTDAADRGQPGSAETYVEIWTNFEEAPDIEETEVVEDICQRVFERVNDWLVSRNLISISRAKDFSIIPPSAIRWACANDLLEGVSKATGYWNVPLNELLRIGEIIEFIDSNESLKSSQTQKLVMACHLEDVKAIHVIVIPEQIKFLVASREGFGNSFFKPDNSLFLIHRIDRQAQVEVEHFIDVVRWSDPRWTYHSYAEALFKQAKRKGIKCSYQRTERNGNQEIDGISFQLSKELTQDLTLHILVDEVSSMLSNVVNDAKLSLTGGPIWDDVNDVIYQKDERRFCEEVLAVLLKEMGFLLVRDVHGTDEYGRDFIFAEKMPFLELRYYGLQAKAGDISGRAKSQIDTILSQIEDAFTMPYTKEPEKSKSEIYINTMIVAISGEFKRNAVEKIRAKIPPHLVGSVYFWDKTKIRSLIYEYWEKEKD